MRRRHSEEETRRGETPCERRAGSSAAGRARPDERGVATAWAVVLIAVLGLGTFMAAGATAVIGARHRAESAADLAALAGAVTARDGGEPCSAASEVAGYNDATLSTCTVSDRVVEVSVAVRTTVLWGATWKQVGVARAGPAT